MDHTGILPALGWLPTDHATACVLQLGRLDALIADLQALPPGDPQAAAKLHQAFCDASALYHESAGHAAGGRPDLWYLSMVGTLNTLAMRHQLEQSPMPWEPSG